MPEKFQPSVPPPHSASDAIPHVPGELLDELHQADQAFTNARLERENAVDSPSDSDAPRENARRHVREAEKAVEAATEKIDDIIRHAENSPNPQPAKPAHSE